MELSGTPADVALLKPFSPLDGMKAENVIALARKTSRRQAPKGRVLFREDDIMYLAKPSAYALSVNPIAMIDSLLLRQEYVTCKVAEEKQ